MEQMQTIGVSLEDPLEDPLDDLVSYQQAALAWP